jgi:uncharacterized protein (TIGR02145 family)
VAILDFENVSGAAEYESWGKALSNMLITDLANNIHPKKVEFFERSQLNKLLEEQNLQKSKNFDQKTAVDFGKLSGVNYVFVGSVFVMGKTCNFSSKLVDVQTSKILLAKDVSGNVEEFLKLKTELAEAIANQLNYPILLEPAYKEPSTTPATINQYLKILTNMDGGDMEKAEELRRLFEETNPEFRYFADVKEDIERLKIRVGELENVAGIITNSFDLGTQALEKADFINAIKYLTKYLSVQDDGLYSENKKLYAYCKLALSYFQQEKYELSLENASSALQIYKYHPDANKIALLSNIKLNEIDKAKVQYSFIVDSLSFDNELKFVRNEINDRLKWTNIRSVYYGLKIEENNDLEEENESDDQIEKWGYKGLRENGFGSITDNEITLKEYLKKEKISYDLLFQDLSLYSKLEKQLIEMKDPLLFSSDQILNFYKLSLLHAEELLQQKKVAEYKLHVEKEIKRMDAFGVECDGCTERRALGANNDRYDEIQKRLSGLGLTNSILQFWEQFPLIYGEFLLNYLIALIDENQVAEAAELYNSFLTGVNKKRSSYFYNYYWDIVLKLRVETDDINSRRELSSELFIKKLDRQIQQMLSKRNISLLKFEAVKGYQIIKKKGSLEVEEDLNLNTSDIIWSKNLGIIKDGEGKEIKYAKNEEELRKFSSESIPAYCYYDFEDNYGEPYGKLYNYYAMKRIGSFPPNGWRIARGEDFLLLVDSATIPDEEYEVNKIKDSQSLNLPMSGEFNSSSFDYMDRAASFWTDEPDPDDPIYQIVVSIFGNKEIYFESINCDLCYYSIRLVKNK